LKFLFHKEYVTQKILLAKCDSFCGGFSSTRVQPTLVICR